MHLSSTHVKPLLQSLVNLPRSHAKSRLLGSRRSLPGGSLGGMGDTASSPSKMRSAAQRIPPPTSMSCIVDPRTKDQVFGSMLFRCDGKRLFQQPLNVATSHSAPALARFQQPVPYDTSTAWAFEASGTTCDVHLLHGAKTPCFLVSCRRTRLRKQPILCRRCSL
ncbi:hypothetical protein BKA70DRAFT_136139 [Coprinopsis sp. MPI-PUGE-AT-0042]|nr:hypothetical protein BKA70DRAFT_136139 [Coprinopsis sp. MPI-PUGE-AT-0042]